MKLYRKIFSPHNMLNKLKKAQNFFLLFALFWGFIFIIFNPPFQAPDEPEHFYKMYGFTELSLNFKKIGAYSGQTLPLSIIEVGKEFKSLAFYPDKKTSKAEIVTALNKPLEKYKTAFYIHNSTSYTPISYFPQFLIMWVMKILNMNPLWMMYIIRICSLILYTSLCYTAIKLMPVRQWLLTLIAILPMSLYQGGAVSTDPLTLGLAFIFTAYVLRLALLPEIKKLKKKDYIIFAVLISLISVCKFAYLPMILMYFMIPKEKFESKKFRFTYFSGLLLVNIIYIFGFIFYTIHITQGITPLYKYHPTENKLDLIKFILTQPLIYLEAVLRTMCTLTHEYIETIIGRFGWMDTVMPRFLTASYFILLIIASVYGMPEERKDIVYSLKMKITGAVIYFLTFFITLTSIYLIFQQWPVITGLQGRYLLPVFPLICLFFTNNKFQYKYLPLLIGITSTFLLYVSLVVLIKRFYIF